MRRRLGRSRQALQSAADFLSALGALRLSPAELLAIRHAGTDFAGAGRGARQLRLLQSGGTIVVDAVQHASSGIDTPADYAAFVARLRKAG